MKARQLLDEQAGVYKPAQLKVITTAFDAAWDEIKASFDPDGLQAQSYRLRLANIILKEAGADPKDAGKLKRTALERLALEYKKRTP
jgi:hypothetical protein